jgi:hypothetical protein
MFIENNLEQIASTEALHIIAEASHLDPVDEWWQAAANADALLKEHLLRSPELQSRMFSLHFLGCLGFARAAKFLLCEACRQDGAFCFPLNNWGWADMFAIMVPAGFFVLDGFRYKLAVPRELTFDVVGSALSKLHETEDSEGFQHPELYLYTMTRDAARALCEELRKRSIVPTRHDALALASLVDNAAGTELD